jgi:hypothetical protein
VSKWFRGNDQNITQLSKNWENFKGIDKISKELKTFKRNKKNYEKNKM